eukprot:scaffold160642_cov24-Tisochrysis_lutea.AAC.1
MCTAGKGPSFHESSKLRWHRRLACVVLCVISSACCARGVVHDIQCLTIINRVLLCSGWVMVLWKRCQCCVRGVVCDIWCVNTMSSVCAVQRMGRNS